eukprot:5956429-Pyramimonas_sp.AAC.1
MAAEVGLLGERCTRAAEGGEAAPAPKRGGAMATAGADGWDIGRASGEEEGWPRASFFVVVVVVFVVVV